MTQQRRYPSSGRFAPNSGMPGHMGRGNLTVRGGTEIMSQQVIATDTKLVDDPVLGIQRKVIAGQPVPPDLVEAYNSKATAKEVPLEEWDHHTGDSRATLGAPGGVVPTEASSTTPGGRRNPENYVGEDADSGERVGTVTPKQGGGKRGERDRAPGKQD